MKKIMFVRLSGVVLALSFGSSVSAQGSQGGELPPPRLIRITDDVYTIENANPTIEELVAHGGNVTVYLTDEGVILVDTKFAHMHDFVMEQVRTLTDLPVKLVIVTHNHADHSGGAAQMQARGATAIMSAADRENMVRDSETSPPYVAYSGELQVVVGRKEVRLREFRGHTRGDTVAYLPAARVVVAGDLVTTVDSIPVIVNYADGGSWSDLGRTLDEIAEMDFDYLVGGHGPVLTKQEYLRLRDKLAGLRERFRDMNRQGASQEEIAEALVAEFNWGGPGPATGNIPGMMQELR